MITPSEITNNIDPFYIESSKKRYFNLYVKFPSLHKTEYDKIEQELQNLAHSFFWAIKNKNIEHLRIFWDGIKDFLMDRGFWNIFADWGHQILSAINHSNDLFSAWLSADLGWLAMEQFDYKKSYRLFQKSRAIFFSLDENTVNKKDLQLGMSSIIRYLGVLYYRSGNYSKARECFDNSLSLTMKYKIIKSKALIYNLYGSLERKARNYKKAMWYYKKSLRILKRTKSSWEIPVVLSNIGKQYMETGKFNSARNILNDAMERSKILKRKDILFRCQLILANIELSSSNYQEALIFAQNAREGYADLGMLNSIKSSQKVIENIRQLSNRHEFTKKS